MVTLFQELCPTIFHPFPHPFLRRWSVSPACRMVPARGSALLPYGPSGSEGQQVQIDSPWDKCLLKEWGKATGNYFISWSGEKNVVMGLKSGRARRHVWVISTFADIGFAKTWKPEVLRSPYINPTTHSKGPPLPRTMAHFMRSCWQTPLQLCTSLEFFGKTGFHLLFPQKHKSSPNFSHKCNDDTRCVTYLGTNRNNHTKAVSLWQQHIQGNFQPCYTTVSDTKSLPVS